MKWCIKVHLFFHKKNAPVPGCSSGHRYKTRGTPALPSRTPPAGGAPTPPPPLIPPPPPIRRRTARTSPMKLWTFFFNKSVNMFFFSGWKNCWNLHTHREFVSKSCQIKLKSDCMLIKNIRCFYYNLNTIPQIYRCL